MISLTILELLYLVLIFFVVIIGTLLSIILIRVSKVVKVAADISDMYFQCKQMIAAIPIIIQEKITERFSEKTEQSDINQKQEDKE